MGEHQHPSVVFIYRASSVAQVIPGIKGYAWITGISLPLAQGSVRPSGVALHALPTTQRRYEVVLFKFDSVLVGGRRPPTVYARGKILCVIHRCSISDVKHDVNDDGRFTLS